MTSDRSRFYDSRLSVSPGVGYPSCNTELARIPPNNRDPHGYYAELGVPPWSTPEQIKAAARHLYRDLHPDTGTRPDPARLQRVKLIAEVLLDPELRAAYNATPPGRRMLDQVYRHELNAMDFSGLDPADLEAILDPEPPPPPKGRGYDYLAVDHRPGDAVRAYNWYEALIAAAPIIGYRGRIKVLVHDGPPFFHHDTAVMAVPRRWWPTKALAFALFTAVADIVPGKNLSPRR